MAARTVEKVAPTQRGLTRRRENLRGAVYAGCGRRDGLVKPSLTWLQLSPGSGCRSCLQAVVVPSFERHPRAAGGQRAGSRRARSSQLSASRRVCDDNMLLRVAAVTLTSATAIFMAAPSALGSVALAGTPSKCDRSGSRTIARNAEVRLFSVRNDSYEGETFLVGCWRRSGRRHTLATAVGAG